jgi:hypothetical protein
LLGRTDGGTSDAWWRENDAGESQIAAEQSYRSDESAIGTDSDRRDAVLGSHIIIAQGEQTLPARGGEGPNQPSAGVEAWSGWWVGKCKW